MLSTHLWSGQYFWHTFVRIITVHVPHYDDDFHSLLIRTILSTFSWSEHTSLDTAYGQKVKDITPSIAWRREAWKEKALDDLPWNHTNTGIVYKKQRWGNVERIWAFPSVQIPSWTELSRPGTTFHASLPRTTLSHPQDHCSIHVAGQPAQ